MRRYFEIHVSVEVYIALDENLTPDEEWRSTFYPFHSLGEMAEHIVFNRVCQHPRGQIEGIAPEEESLFEFLEVLDWKVKAEELRGTSLYTTKGVFRIP